MSAVTYCEGGPHLAGVHLGGTVYCLSYRRHLSSLHPLYDFFKYHCEGTIPHVAVNYGLLTKTNGSVDSTYSIRGAGFVQLAVEDYEKRNYRRYTYENLINVRYCISFYFIRVDNRTIDRRSLECVVGSLAVCILI